MEAALVESKPNTRKNKILKQKVVNKFDMPIKNVVTVEESDDIESEYDFEEEVDDDVAKRVAAQRQKSKAGISPLTKTIKTKRVLINNPASTS